MVVRVLRSWACIGVALAGFSPLACSHESAPARSSRSSVAIAAGGGNALPVCAAGATYGSPLASPTIAATLVKGGFKFIEGPVWFAGLGVLFFSDMNFRGDNAKGPPSVMHRLTPPSTVDDFLPTSGSNGLAIAPDGQILAATHDTQSLTKFDPVARTRTNLDLTYMGKHFNSPNDVAVRSDGNIYFSDPNYQLGSRTSQTMITGVYRVSPSGLVSLIDDKQQQPNGVTLSIDENTLYVSNAKGAIDKYAVSPDGSTGTPSLFVQASSDGMTKDCAGNLYTTNASEQSVDIYGPSGAKIGRITGVAACTNVAFGGADRKTLYITSGPDQSAALYAAELGVPGYPY